MKNASEMPNSYLVAFTVREKMCWGTVIGDIKMFPLDLKHLYWTRASLVVYL